MGCWAWHWSRWPGVGKDYSSLWFQSQNITKHKGHHQNAIHFAAGETESTSFISSRCCCCGIVIKCFRLLLLYLTANTPSLPFTNTTKAPQPNRMGLNNSIGECTDVFAHPKACCWYQSTINQTQCFFLSSLSVSIHTHTHTTNLLVWSYTNRFIFMK